MWFARFLFTSLKENTEGARSSNTTFFLVVLFRCFFFPMDNLREEGVCHPFPALLVPVRPLFRGKRTWKHKTRACPLSPFLRNAFVFSLVTGWPCPAGSATEPAVLPRLPTVPLSARKQPKPTQRPPRGEGNGDAFPAPCTTLRSRDGGSCPSDFPQDWGRAREEAGSVQREPG